MLPIRFNVSGVSSTRIIGDIRVTSKDEYRNLVYLAKPEGHQIPISFVGMPEPTPSDIRIVDVNEIPGTLQITENSFRARVRRVQNQNIFTLPTKSAVITDVTNSDPTGRVLPMWYRHTITDGLETSPQILDNEMRPVPGEQYKVVVEANEVNIFHDLYPYVDQENLRTQAYYIRYTNTAGEQIFALLNSDPAYQKLTILDDIDQTKRQYVVRRQGVDFEYRVLFNGAATFYVKIGVRDQIKLQKPLIVRPSGSWYLEVTDGEVYGRADEISEFYSVPEFHLQQFSPIEPVKFSGTTEGLVLTNHLVKAPFENILLDDNHTIDILITDRDMTPRAGFTSRPSDPAPYWVDRFEGIRPGGSIVRYPLSQLSPRGITIHKDFGLINIPFNMADTDRVFIRAKYESKTYKYLHLNLNPLHSRNMIGGRALVYCVPDSLVDENLRSIYHIILNEDNDIVYWNDNRLGEDGVLNPLLVPGVGETGYELFLENFPKFLILGTIAINRNISPTELSYIDVRERGGVLTEETRRNLAALLETYPQLQWVDDESLHGRNFPGLGAFVLDVPFSVLEDAGGEFTEENVQGTVERHSALGSHPVIRYYADKPKILAVEFDDTAEELTITWSSVEHADSYRVYVAEDAEGPYLPIDVDDSAGVPDNSREATVGFTGATSVDVSIIASTKLYVYIAPMKDSTEWPSSDTAYIDLTNESGSEFCAMDAILASPPTATAALDAILIEA